MTRDSSTHSASDSGTAGVLVRPIRLFPVALLLGLALDHVLPWPVRIPGSGVVHLASAVVAGALALVGVLLFAAAARGFSRAATPLPTVRPARTLVTAGVHGWSRNPIYLAFCLMYVGVGLAVRSEWVLALTVPLAIVIRYGVVAREEAYLERRFGDSYRDYASRVRRWL